MPSMDGGMEFGMFTNIGGKIKVFVIVLTILEIIACIVCGIAVIAFAIAGDNIMGPLSMVGLDEPVLKLAGGFKGPLGILVGLVVMIAGSLAAWLAAFIPFGLGQLIQNTDKMVKGIDGLRNTMSRLPQNPHAPAPTYTNPAYYNPAYANPAYNQPPAGNPRAPQYNASAGNPASAVKHDAPVAEPKAPAPEVKVAAPKTADTFTRGAVSTTPDEAPAAKAEKPADLDATVSVNTANKIAAAENVLDATVSVNTANKNEMKPAPDMTENIDATVSVRKKSDAPMPDPSIFFSNGSGEDKK